MAGYCPNAGDIIWLDFPQSVGNEQAGRRPALVLSPHAFNDGRKSSLDALFGQTVRSPRRPFRWKVYISPLSFRARAFGAPRNDAQSNQALETQH